MQRTIIGCLLLALSLGLSAATRYSVAAGNWSAAGTWDTPPVDGDAVVIAHAVTQDVDMSAYATGVTITINSGGSLEPSATAGMYGIKCGGHLTVNSGGRLGPASGAIAYGVKWTINLNGARYITGAGTVRLICTEPDITVVKLNTHASAGATTLDVRNLDGSSVDLSTGTVPWLATEDVRVDNAVSYSSEARTIASVSANTVVLTAGLTATKAAGSLVVLVTRNVWVTGATGYAFSSATALTLAAQVSGNVYGLGSCSGVTITGGTLSGQTYGLYSCSGATITGGVLMSRQQYGLFNCSGRLRDAMLSSTTADMYACNQVTLSNCLMAGTVENSQYNTAQANAAWYVSSTDHDQAAGAYKAWSKGGVTTSQSTTVPAGYSSAYQIALESATYWGFYQAEYTLAPGETMRWIVYRNQTVNASSKAEIVDLGHDPLVGGTALDTHTYTTGTGTWEAGQLEYTNSGAIPATVHLRVSGLGATGTLYFLPVSVLGREAW